MARHHRKFVPLTEDEQKVVEKVLAASDRLAEHLDSLTDGIPDRFWIGLLERLLNIASLGPQLLRPYPPEVLKKHEKQYDALRPSTDAFFARLNLFMSILCERCRCLATHYPEDGFECEREAAMLLPTDLAELLQDLEHCNTAWATKNPEVMAEAEWELRFGYEYHWGEHLHRAINTVHQIICCTHVE